MQFVRSNSKGLVAKLISQKITKVIIFMIYENKIKNTGYPGAMLVMPYNEKIKLIMTNKNIAPVFSLAKFLPRKYMYLQIVIL